MKKKNKRFFDHNNHLGELYIVTHTMITATYLQSGGGYCMPAHFGHYFITHKPRYFYVLTPEFPGKEALIIAKAMMKGRVKRAINLVRRYKNSRIGVRDLSHYYDRWWDDE